MRLFWLVSLRSDDDEDVYIWANDPKEALDFYLRRLGATGRKSSPIIGINEFPKQLGCVVPKRLGGHVLPIADPISTSIIFLGARRTDEGLWLFDEMNFDSDGMTDVEYLQKLFFLLYSEALVL